MGDVVTLYKRIRKVFVPNGYACIHCHKLFGSEEEVREHLKECRKKRTLRPFVRNK